MLQIFAQLTFKKKKIQGEAFTGRNPFTFFSQKLEANLK